MSFFPEDRALELRNLFFESARELLQVLNEQGLELERHPADPELIRAIRRSVHTLKGDSGACGFKELSQLAHELEDVLKPDLTMAQGQSLAEIVLSAVDVFDAMLSSYQKDVQLPDTDTLRQSICHLLQEPVATHGNTELAPQFQWSEYERLVGNSALGRGEQVFSIALMLDRSSPMKAAAAQVALTTLEGAGTVIARRPETLSADNAPDTVELALTTSLTDEELKHRCTIPFVVEKVVIEPWTAKATGVQDPPTVQPDPQVTETSPEPIRARAGDSSVLESTLRVDSERIDVLMNLVGELIIGKSVLQQAVSDFGRRFPKDPLKARFADVVSRQSQVLHSLQRSVMKIRMVPVEQLFRRIPRVLRDAAKSCNKEVELLTAGYDTEMDKGILDQLAEPLTHIVRNAVDHGIEAPDVRLKLGKTSQGFVKLNAYHLANHVVIEVSDDGRGMSPDDIAARALAKGLTTSTALAQFTDHQKLELIFESGFSTADEVTTISGRGVGMDVVRSVISRLKGTIQILTAPGQGTTFRLTLPLTLAIIESLLFEVEERCYAVPLSSVVEITRATANQVHQVENCEVLRLREETLPLVRLSCLVAEEAKTMPQKFFLVVVTLAGRKIGLVVVTLIGEDELVIKSLDDQLVATDLVSGGSIRGDGTVVLILNVTALVDRVGQNATGPASKSRLAEVGTSS